MARNKDRFLRLPEAQRAWVRETSPETLTSFEFEKWLFEECEDSSVTPKSGRNMDSFASDYDAYFRYVTTFYGLRCDIFPKQVPWKTAFEKWLFAAEGFKK